MCVPPTHQALRLYDFQISGPAAITRACREEMTWPTVTYKESESERQKKQKTECDRASHYRGNGHASLHSAKCQTTAKCAVGGKGAHALSFRGIPTPPRSHSLPSPESTVSSVTARQSTRCGENDTHPAARHSPCEAARALIGCGRTRGCCLEEAVGRL